MTTANSQAQPAIEQRRVYSYSQCELNIFETTQQVEAIPLVFKDLAIMSMMRGKKIMHFDNQSSFDYLPGESLIIPPKQAMLIDYPDAQLHDPTQCTALVMEEHFVRQTFAQLDAQYRVFDDSHSWMLSTHAFHFVNSAEITALISKIVRLSMEHKPMNELRIELSLKELLVLIAQQQHLSYLNRHDTFTDSNDQFAHVVQFIKQHLSEKISIDQLSRLAYMSRTNFFKSFKLYLGLSPADYILRERISLAKQLLQDPTVSIAEVAYQSGFNNIPYFIRQFKKQERLTPGEYRLMNG